MVIRRFQKCKTNIERRQKFLIVSVQIRRYITSHGCTIKEFSKIANVSEAVVRKWLYKNCEPSQRMLGRLAGVKDFFNETELQYLKSNGILDDDFLEKLDNKGGIVTLATLIAQKAETYKVKKNSDHIEVEFRISNKTFYEPVNLEFSYNEIQKTIDERHYVLKPEDIE